MKKTRFPKRNHGFVTIKNDTGESIEAKVRRVTQENEPITDGAEMIYTQKADGVKPEFNIRTDKWDIALDAMDKVAASRIAESKQYGLPPEEKKGNEENAGSKPPAENG